MGHNEMSKAPSSPTYAPCFLGGGGGGGVQDKIYLLLSNYNYIYIQRNYLYLLVLLLLVKYILCSVTNCFLIFEKI